MLGLLVACCAVALIGFTWLRARFSGWARLSKSLAPSEPPRVWLNKVAICRLGLGTCYMSIGAGPEGLCFAPWAPSILGWHRLCVPWDEIDLGGPLWPGREDLSLRGLELAVPRDIAEVVRSVRRGNVPW